MDPEAQPTPIKGERNIHCPHYSDCLDYVVNRFWESWSCSECPHRKEVPVGEVGEIVCRGPIVMKGYYKDEEGTKEALRGGWLHTGDLARVDDEGFFYIVDRKKDIVISGGENIYPREIEEILYTHPKIADAAVIGVPDDIWGESVKAVVVLKEGQTMAEEEVIEFCQQHLASYKRPRSVDFVDVLPRNPSGKVLKTELRARCREREQT